jgi:hypothetical protein
LGHLESADLILVLTVTGALVDQNNPQVQMNRFLEKKNKF